MYDFQTTELGKKFLERGLNPSPHPSPFNMPNLKRHHAQYSALPQRKSWLSLAHL